MKLIGITGPESTGKSLLAGYLAAHFRAPLIGEYAREYMDKLDRPYTQEDVAAIGREQYKRITEASGHHHEWVIADTELLVISIWLEFKYGIQHPEVESMVKTQPVDFYLLCDIDLPWEEDPLRENPNERQQLFDLYRQRLDYLKFPYKIVRGIGSQRFINALNILYDPRLSL
ncbi:MAG TPA: AAA family ATPase [Bacteroidales bacterium]|nr:AAA family ATPase [Bacteroidales bacterium]HRZ48343.1 AAA family ATPase [Bacteroidales bacterium]